jgi:hypothetical protein
MLNSHLQRSFSRLWVKCIFSLVLTMCTLGMAADIPYEKKETWQESVRLALMPM